MLSILILGASSQIGGEIALRFSTNNSLTIVGRREARLRLIAERCLEAGAERVNLIELHIGEGIDLLLQKTRDQQFDLVINLVAATSRVKDSGLIPNQLEQYLMSDLLVPVQLIAGLREKTSKPLDVIFISSILAAVKSPDREVYGSLKRLQEICLGQMFTGSQGGNLLIVKVGKVIPHERASPEARELANKVYEAYFLKKKILNFGFGGWVYLILYYMQPIVFNWIVKLQRLLRGSQS